MLSGLWTCYITGNLSKECGVRVISINHTRTKSPSDEHRRACSLADELHLLARIERGRKRLRTLVASLI